MITLPPPRYTVEGYEGNRGAHMYRVLANPNPESYLIMDHLPSVTKKLDLIGGGKTAALMGWAVKEAVHHMEEEMLAALSENVPFDSNLIRRVGNAARKKPERIKDAAADLGTRVHNLIDEWILTGKTRHQDPDEMVAFANFMSFVSERNLKFICGDLAVASLRLKYGGRLDALAMMGNKLVLLDWKTSNAIRDDYALQVAGYREALKETYGLLADRAIVVRFDKFDPKVLDFKEVAIAQATRTWKALVKFGSEYERRAWK